MVSPSGGQFESAYDNDEDDASPLAANLVGGADERGEHRRAGGSYSRFVTVMKVVLPLVAVGLIALVIAWPRLQAESMFRLGFASVNLTGQSEPGMDNARYVGTDENRQPFSVTADIARLAREDGALVNLELPKADLTLKDGTWLVLTANTGQYDRDRKKLALQGAVNLFHDTGYEMTTSQLDVDLQAGGAEGHEPVSGHGPFGELKSQGIRLIDKGRVIFFTGPAQVVLYPPQ